MPKERYAPATDDVVLERMRARRHPPVTLPMQAYGPQPITWTLDRRAPVWVWVQWTDGPAERIASSVKGHNDRVCIVTVPGEGGGWEIVVWRNAVTHREA